MIRILFTYIVPIVLPTVVYLMWAKYMARRRAADRLAGDEDNLDELPVSPPWFWLIVSGVILLLATLSYVALTGGHEPGGTYVPHRYVDGQVVPSEIRPGE